MNPLMIMTGDKSARLDLSKTHAFGEQGYAVIEPNSRGGSSFEVSEQALQDKFRQATPQSQETDRTAHIVITPTSCIAAFGCNAFARGDER